jgi:exodeoxyribonuclease VII large subunit
MQVQPRGKMVYLSLGEYDEEGIRPRAVLSLVCPMFRWQKLQAIFFDKTKMRIEAELKVCLLLEADLYIPQGKFQGKISHIDPTYTVGELALRREQILNRLREEGLLHKNRSLEFPLLPLRIGLITAPDSAAEQDFLHGLRDSGYGFQVEVAYARMQGADTESSVLGAMAVLENKIQVLCICRGGGSRSDLHWFDNEALCRAAAQYPVPVITGIGHQIDSSLLDMVAFKQLMTPTDCADFISDHMRNLEQWVEMKFQRISENLGKRLAAEKNNLVKISDFIQGSIPKRLELEKQRHALMHNGLRKGPVKILNLAQSLFVTHSSHFKSSCTSMLREQELWVKQCYWQLNAQSRNILEKEKSSFPVLAKLVRTLDPRSQLKKGYAITRNLDGKVVSSSKCLKKGDSISVEFQDGTLRSVIE